MKIETKKDERFEKIQDFINDYVGEVSHVDMWNAYCDEVHYPEDIIYNMSDIDDIFGRMFPTDLFRKLDDVFCWNDDYFYVDRNGYLSSTDFPEEDIIDDDELIAYMIENDEDFGYLGIRKILEYDFDDLDE